MHPVAGVFLAYALGSIPFAYIAGWAHGVDLRKHGSGNLGATNAARVLGTRTGAVVYLLDTLKGFAAAFALPRALGLEAGGEWAVAYAVAAVVGHVRPVFLGFKRGGKGVATAGGGFLGLAPLATGAAILVFTVTLLATGYVSVGSLAAAVTLPVALLVLGASPVLLVVATALAAFVFWTHRTNIARLRDGEEHRFDPLRRGRRTSPEQGS